MEEIDSLYTRQFDSTLETLYPALNLPTSEINSNLKNTLLKYSTSNKTLKKLSKLHASKYFSRDKLFFFTEQEAEKIAYISNGILNNTSPGQSQYISRKVSQLSIKLIFPCDCNAFLILPKKKDQPKIISNEKNGRIALLIQKINERWSSELLFNLTT